MADTPAATGLTVQQWDDQFFVDSTNAEQFSFYYGTDENSVIQMQETLTKKVGDSVTFALVNRLTNSAVTGSNTLEGNEETMQSRSQKVTIDQARNAVRVADLEEQFSAIPLRNAARTQLMTWKMELIRDDIIAALGSINGVAYGTASEAQKDAWLVDNTDRVLFGAATSNHTTDHSAALANIDSTNDKLTPAALKLMKRRALQASPKVGPIKPRTRTSRSDAYVLFTGPLTLRDLTENSTFLQETREARERGKGNPIFAGADYVYDGIAIILIEDIASITGVGASSIDVAPVYLCGAQALGYAIAKRSFTKEDTFDYGDKKGVAVGQWYNIEKMTFGTGSGDTDDLKDHGIVTGFFSAVAD